MSHLFELILHPLLPSMLERGLVSPDMFNRLSLLCREFRDTLRYLRPEIKDTVRIQDIDLVAGSEELRPSDVTVRIDNYPRVGDCPRFRIRRDAEAFFEPFVFDHLRYDTAGFMATSLTQFALRLWRKICAQTAFIRFVAEFGWRIVAVRELDGTEKFRAPPSPMRVVRQTVIGRQFEALLIHQAGSLGGWTLPLAEQYLSQVDISGAVNVAGFLDDLTDYEFLEDIMADGRRIPGVGMTWLSSNVTIYDRVGGQKVLASFRAIAPSGRTTTFCRHFTPTEAKVLRDGVDRFNVLRTVAETRRLLP